MKTDTPENPALSDTPRCDAKEIQLDQSDTPDHIKLFETRDFARTLERDKAELRVVGDQAVERLVQCGARLVVADAENTELRSAKERLWAEFSRLVTAVEVGMTDEGRAGYNKQILERAQAFWKSATLTGDPKSRVGQRRVYAFTVATCLAEAGGWVMAVQDDVRKPITITAEYWDLLETAPAAREVLL